MAKAIKKETLHAGGIDIGIYTTDFKNEFISLTDIAKFRSIDPRVTIHNWLRSRDVVEFLGVWESLHNPDFKRIEFDTFKENAGANAFGQAARVGGAAAKHAGCVGCRFAAADRMRSICCLFAK